MISLALIFPLGQVSAASIPHQVTNVRDKAFSLSWISDNKEAGYVNYGISPGNLNISAYDDRGQMTIDDTHHVNIVGLNPGTTYYYEIVSGNVTYNNNGSPYELTTGPSLAFTMPEMISGRVYKANGAKAEGTIIYVSISTSQVLSSIVNDQGAWALDIAPIRTADYQAYVAYTNGDAVSVDARGGSAGTASITTTVAVAKDGTLEATLAGGIEQDNASTPVDDTDGDQTGVLTTQSGSIHWWVWLAIGLVAVGIIGFLLKKFVFYHD
jgi:hypothetical protein